jgi:hypothetical protein
MMTSSYHHPHLSATAASGFREGQRNSFQNFGDVKSMAVDNSLTHKVAILRFPYQLSRSEMQFLHVGIAASSERTQAASFYTVPSSGRSSCLF